MCPMIVLRCPFCVNKMLQLLLLLLLMMMMRVMMLSVICDCSQELTYRETSSDKSSAMEASSVEELVGKLTEGNHRMIKVCLFDQL